jgi:hypothetical protein
MISAMDGSGRFPSKLMIRLPLLAAACCLWAPAQITSLQSSPNEFPAANVTSVTSGSPLPNGFTIYINAPAFTFDPAGETAINWNNLGGGPSTIIPGEVTNNGSQVFGIVPPSMFSTLVNSNVTVAVSVTQAFTTNSLNFLIVPQPSAVNNLPTAFIGQPYSTPVVQNGTAPFTNEVIAGSLPAGLSFNNLGNGVSGTPTGPPGLSAFQSTLIDFWGNPVALNASINVARVTPVATLTVSPNPAPFGQNVTLAARVTSALQGTPTGSVTFLDNGLPIGGGTVNLINGLAAFVTASLLPGSHPISFSYSGDINFTGAVSNAQTLVVNAGLSITTTSLPVGTASQNYSANITATGGVQPYTFSAQGLPGGLNLNPQTGAISGLTSNSGSFPVTFLVVDSQGNRAAANLTLSIVSPAVRISPFATLPDGTVGVGYSGTVGAVGGVSPITFSISRGSPPPGLNFQSSGLLSGTPTTVGRYSFTVTVSDAANTSDSKDFTVTINPPPLSVPGGSSNPTGPAGTPLNINFGCTGGTPPYTYSVSGSLPPGVSFGNCALTGTPTTPGVYTIHITVRDSAGASITKDVTITVTAASLSLVGMALPNGQAGVAYSASISATGGVPPISYSGSGLPDGLSLGRSGAITGTPTTAGQFSFRVTATDSSVTTAPVSVTATFSITILPASVAFGPASLPDGVVGLAYSGSVSATGGTSPYSFSITGLPDGLSGSSAGAVSGTPTKAGKFTATATVTDSAGAHATQQYTITIGPAALVITTTSAPNGTVGTAYSATFAATGGTAPYTFSATGQPSTLTMSAGGTLSGTPTAAATVSLTVTVKDSSGVTLSKSFTFTIALPAPSTLSFGGISSTVNPMQQPRITVSLASPYPVDLLVTLTLTTQPVSGPPDPAVVFSTGGTTTTIIIPAGSLNGATDVGVQTGTVAGNIVITAKLTAGGSDVTPSPAPSRSMQVAPAAPVLISVSATRTSSGFTVTVIGYVTDREITAANFTFTGTNLGTTGLPVTADSIFASWFGGSTPPSTPYGGQFSYVQQFTVNGSNTAITSVSVTLTNKVGTSNSLSATLN